MASTLSRRVAVAAVAIPAAVGLVRLGGWYLTGVLALLGALGTWEVFQIARARGVQPFGRLGLLSAVAMPPLVLLYVTGAPIAQRPGMGAAVLALWVILVMAVAVWRRPPGSGPLGAIAVTLVAPLYTALLPSFVLVIRHGVADRDPWVATWLVFLPLVIIWVCDTAAMFVGGWVGGAKFAPTISPNKTWSGTVGGVIGGIGAGPAWAQFVLLKAGLFVAHPRVALLGAVLAIVGQIGDLAESLLKREAGIKDSGRAFGAHGGVLDRLDSLYWAVPVAAIMLRAWGIV